MVDPIHTTVLLYTRVFMQKLVDTLTACDGISILFKLFI